MRRYIAFSLTALGVLFLVFVVAGGLWGLLSAVGDRGAAQGAIGVTLVAAVCWGLNFVALVVLLAVAYLRAADASAQQTRSAEESDEAGD